MRLECEDYCDQKLASFEIVLERTMKTVAAGRTKLQGNPLAGATEASAEPADAETTTGRRSSTRTSSPVATRATPFVVGVTELLRHPGTRRAIVVTAPLDDLALSSSRVLEGIRGRGAAHARGAERHVGHRHRHGHGRWMGECRRCLATVEGSLEADVREIFEARPVEGETYPLDGDRLDLEPMVRDAVLLALPLAPLCEEACAGPEPDDHPLGADDDPRPDDRWAALEELKFD